MHKNQSSLLIPGEKNQDLSLSPGTNYKLKNQTVTSERKRISRTKPGCQEAKLPTPSNKIKIIIVT